MPGVQSTLKGMFKQLPALSPDSQIISHKAAKGPSRVHVSPEEELARRIADDRRRASDALKDVFRNFDARLFPGNGKKEANRPRFIDNAATLLVDELSLTYCAEMDGDLKAWASRHATEFFAKWIPTSRVAPHLAVAAPPGGAAAGVSAPDEDVQVAAAPKKPHLNLWAHSVTRRIIQACCHKFSADGSHVEFRKTKEIQALVKSKLELPEDLPYQTVHDWLKKEEKVKRTDVDRLVLPTRLWPPYRLSLKFAEASRQRRMLPS